MSIRSRWAALALVLAISAVPSGVVADAMPVAAPPVASAGLFVLDPDPGSSTPVDSTTPPGEVTDWFANRASAVLNSEGIEVFSKLAADKLRELSIGDPVQSVSFADGAVNEQNALTPGQRWVAPILDGNQVVGAISADYVSGAITNEEVMADVRLGTETAQNAGAAGTALIYDPALKAWFALRDQAIEPADKAGSSIVLGAVPLEDFLAQRSRILSEDNGIAKVVADDTQSSTDIAVSLPGVLIIFFSLLMLITLSLVWLRWDSNENHRNTEDADEPEKKAAKPSGKQKPRYTELVEKVRVFERPQSASEANDTAETQVSAEQQVPDEEDEEQ